jgi:hypothetical protein
MAWSLAKEDEWYSLPGLAAWWPDDYDYAKHGFDVPLSDDGHFTAYSMIRVVDSMLDQFDMISPEEFELQVLPGTLNTWKLLMKHGFIGA